MVRSSILFLHTDLDHPSGTTRIVREVAAGVADRGYDVHLGAQRQPGDVGDLPGPVHLLGGPPASSARHWLVHRRIARRIDDLVRRLDLDVVVAMAPPTNYWTVHCKRGRHAWICPGLQMFDRPERFFPVLGPLAPLGPAVYPLVKAWDRRAMTGFDAYLSLSHHTRRFMTERYGVEATVMHPGVDLDTFRPGKAARDDYLLTVCQLTPYKDVDVLLEGFAEIADRNADVELRIAGDGPARDDLERLAGRLGIRSRVRFLGWVDDAPLADLYRHALLYVHPATNEPFGMVTAEALASGTPAVGSGSGGTQEIIDPGRTGELFEPGDPSDLAAKVLVYLGNRDRIDEHGAAGRRRVEEHFTWEGTTKAFLDGVEGILP